MGRLEKMKEIREEIEETRHQVTVALKNNNFDSAMECVEYLKEKALELKCLENFDEEAAQMIGGDF